MAPRRTSAPVRNRVLRAGKRDECRARRTEECSPTRTGPDHSGQWPCCRRIGGDHRLHHPALRGGRLQPSQVDPAYDDYVFWLHYAEGSAILPILLKVNASRIGAGASAIEARIEQAMADDLSYIDSSLSLHDYLLGAALSGADIQLSFVGELAARWTDRSRYPNIEAWVRRFQARPAYRAAIERGGPYSLAA
jgi:hypothetical protein